MNDFYKIYLFVNIIDDSDGIFQFIVNQSIVVNPNSDLFNSFADSLINSNSILVNTLKNANIVNACSFINIFTISLNSQNTNNSNYNILVRESLIGIILEMAITNIDSIVLISNSISILTDKKSEIGLNFPVKITFVALIPCN